MSESGGPGRLVNVHIAVPNTEELEEVFHDLVRIVDLCGFAQPVGDDLPVDATVMADTEAGTLTSVRESATDSNVFVLFAPRTGTKEFFYHLRSGGGASGELNTLRSLTVAVTEYLEQVAGQIGTSTEASELWLKSSEILVGYLEVLLQNEHLKEQLERAIGDRDVANARWKQLQAAYDILYNERYRTKDKPDKTNVWAGAAVVVSVLVPIVDDLGDRFIKDTADKAGQIAETVIQQCEINAPIIINEEPVQGAHLGMNEDVMQRLKTEAEADEVRERYER